MWLNQIVLRKKLYMKLSFLLIMLFGIFSFQNVSVLAETSVLTITSPAEGSKINTTTVIVTGTTTVDGTVDLYIDGILKQSVAATTTDGWQATVNNLQEGPHTLVAEQTNLDVVTESNSVTLEVDLTPPLIEITNIVDGDFTNKTFINGTTEPNLEVMVFLNTVSYLTTADNLGNWTFGFSELIVDGSYPLYAKTTDLAGNEGQTSLINFTYDTTRPFISPSLFPRHNMMRVSLATQIQVKIVDLNPITATEVMPEPLSLYRKGSELPVPGTFTYDETTNVVTYTPTQDLIPNSKYYVQTNPLLKDKAGNLIHQRNWSFTTVLSTTTENPHGEYTANDNTCKTCHGTHVAPDPILKEPSAELLQTMTEKTTINYCMACHDGTVAAAPEHFGGGSNHDVQFVTLEGIVESQSCGSCHNPHLTWGEHNPNLLQDHFVFDHSVITGLTIGLIDSKERLCESCHESDSITKKLDTRVEHNYYSYRNWNSSPTELSSQTTFGTIDDYQLCLRCHNHIKSTIYQNVVDIETYYNNTSNAHSITNDRVKDGSLLNGNIPCADCHNSHGSSNIHLVKTELGHTNGTAFTKTTPEWTVSEERAFCLSCHNGFTEVYGITVPFNQTSPAHSDSTKSCKTCHGGSSASFLEAVHGPSKPSPTQ